MVDTRTSTTVHFNTVSNLVPALMSATGNPLGLPAELASGKVTFDERSIIANWSKVESILKPLLAELKTDIADLRSGLALANGTGPDPLLDTLDISISKNRDNTSNIEITIKTAGDGQGMPVIRFTNSMLLEQILKANGSTATAIQNRPIQAASLPAAGTSAQIAYLLKHMTACFVLPVETRAGSPAGIVNAPQCQPCSGMTILRPTCTSVPLSDRPGRFQGSSPKAAREPALVRARLSTSGIMGILRSALFPSTRT